MKEQKFYILKCTAKKESQYSYITFHPGDVFYFSPRASSHEMSNNFHISPYKVIAQYSSYLPFVRDARHAKKWQKISAAEHIKRSIEDKGDFDVEVITLKVQYEVTYA